MRNRRDGTYLEVPALRRIVPYLLRTRTTSTVYFPQRIEVDALLGWLETVNRDRARSERITLFHVFLTAIARTVRLRPEVNRFVAGRRTYEHDQISISFIVKESMSDDGEESEVRLVLHRRGDRRPTCASSSRRRWPTSATARRTPTTG